MLRSRESGGLPPEFATELTEDEVTVALAYIQHGGDTWAVAAELSLPVSDVLGVVARREFRVAMILFMGTLGGTYEQMLEGLRLDFFMRLQEALHSPKDRTRIEAMRMLQGMYEGERKRDARRAERLGEAGVDPAAFDRAATATERLSDAELAHRVARMGQALH